MPSTETGIITTDVSDLRNQGAFWPVSHKTIEPSIISLRNPNTSPVRVKMVRLEHCFDLPKIMTSGAAGMDIYSAENELIPAQGKAAIKTGWKVAIPEGFEMIIDDRSGMYIKHHQAVSGTIDVDYRGEVFIMMHNHSQEDYVIERGDRVAQAKIREVIPVMFEEVTNLDETERGDGKFGHTGK